MSLAPLAVTVQARHAVGRRFVETARMQHHAARPTAVGRANCGVYPDVMAVLAALAPQWRGASVMHHLSEEEALA